MNTVSLAIIILNWNGKNWLEKFLPSVIRHNTYPFSKIYIADNASTDDSIDFMRSYYPEIELIFISENKGYAGGYNDAINQVKEDYICLLNSDIEVTEKWIEPIMTLFASNEKIAAIQPKILDYKNQDLFEYAGAAGGFIDWLGYPCARGRIFDSIETDTGQYDDTSEIFWASGACLFVNRTKFMEAGCLDASLFAHQEEIDLCWRMKNIGYSIMYHSESKVYHVGGGSLPYGNTRKTYLNFRNNLMVILKNEVFPKVILVLFCRFFLDLFAAFYAMVKTKKLQETIAIIKAIFSFYGQFFDVLQERRKHVTPISHKEKLPKSLIINYYLFGKKKFKDIFN